MNLFPGEELVVRSNNDRLVLSTHRLQPSSKDWGASYQNIIFLEDIGSIENKYTSLFIALVIGVLLIVGGLLYAQQNEIAPFNPMAIAGGSAMLIYFFSRSHVVSITPIGGHSLNFETGPMSEDEVADFIDKVQLTKLARKTKMLTQ